MILPTIEIPERPKVFNDAGQDEAWDWVLARRVDGWGDCYLPEFKRVIKVGQLWYLPLEEVEARPDWELVPDQTT